MKDSVMRLIFDNYPNIYDFDIKEINKKGNEIIFIITFRTSLGQNTPIRVKISMDKNIKEGKLERIYMTKAEKIEALRESRIDNFLSNFIRKKLEEKDIDEFMSDNEDIIKQGIPLDKDDVAKMLKLRKEQLESI